MSSISPFSAGSAQFFVQQAAQAKTAAANKASSAQASFADALSAATSSVGVNLPGVVPAATPATSLGAAAKSQISSGAAAVATTDIASSMASNLLNILA